jgi:large-conductance mechanosensitive channel
MNNNEGPIVEFPGMSVLETVVTFFVIPTVMFVVISVLAYAMSKPRKAKTSSITTIE